MNMSTEESVAVDVNESPIYTLDEAIELMMTGFFNPIHLSREEIKNSTFIHDWKFTDEMFESYLKRIDIAFKKKNSSRGLAKSLKFFLNRIRTSVEQGNDGVKAAMFFAPLGYNGESSIRVPISINGITIKAKNQTSGATTYTVKYNYSPGLTNFTLVDGEGEDATFVNMRKYNIEIFKKFEENIYMMYNRIIREFFLGEGAFWKAFRKIIHKVYSVYMNSALNDPAFEYIPVMLGQYSGEFKNAKEVGKSLIRKFINNPEEMKVWEYIYEKTYAFKLITPEMDNEEIDTINSVRSGTNTLNSKHRTPCVPVKRERTNENGDQEIKYYSRMEGEFRFDEIDGRFYYSTSAQTKVPFGTKRFNGFTFSDTRSYRYPGLKLPENYTEIEDSIQFDELLPMFVEMYNGALEAAKQSQDSKAVDNIKSYGALVKNAFGDGVTILGTAVFNIGAFKMYWVNGQLPTFSNKATISDIAFTMNIPQRDDENSRGDTSAMMTEYVEAMKRRAKGDDSTTPTVPTPTVSETESKIMDTLVF